MKLTLRFFGIPVFSASLDSDPVEYEEYVENLGGSFDFAPEQEADEDYYEEDRAGFGFGVT